MLKIETDYAMGDSAQIKTRIEAFLEIIQGKKAINLLFPFFGFQHFYTFNPCALGIISQLEANKMSYRLTKVVPVHGCSCKLPQYQLGGLLDKAGLTGEFWRGSACWSMGKQQRRQNHRQPCRSKYA